MFYFCNNNLFITMKHYPCILTIAGSDCCGGAGIQADIKTISALGAYATSVITAVTAQNTCKVTGIHSIPSAFIKEQIEDVMNDIHPSGIKIGMINNAETAIVIAESIKKFKPEFVVLDPVMVSTSGSSLMEKDAVQAVKDHLFPLSTLITPNIKEAEALLQCDIKEKEAMKQAAKELLQYGSKAVLVKGGHLQQDAMYDILHICNEEEPHIYSLPKIESTNTHGTGCTLSSAITTFLVSGMPLQVAVCKAKEYVHQSILHGKDIQIGAGHGPLNHFHHPIPLHIIEDGSVSL